MQYQLLDRFAALFQGCIYRHRSNTNGDLVAVKIYEDLLTINRSAKYVDRVAARTRVVNVANRATGRLARRGDGSFGERLPHVAAQVEPTFAVRRGPIANIEIGIETKILATAIGKQVQERISSLKEQAEVFRSRNPNVICVAIVGVNHAPVYLAYEGERTQLTDGRKYAHPVQHAAVAVARIRAELDSYFEEVIVLPFIATNQDKLAFAWTAPTVVKNEYGAALLRISQEYERRF